MLLDAGRDALDDFVGVTFVVDDVSVQVARRAQLELGRVGLLVLLDGDFAWHGEVFVFIPHQLNEVLQFLDFLRLHGWLAQIARQRPDSDSEWKSERYLPFCSLVP